MFILERVAEFTYEVPNSVVEAAKHAFLDIHYVRTGQAEPYKAATRRLMEAVRKADYPLGWSAYRMVIGEGTTFYGEGKVYCYVVAVRQSVAILRTALVSGRNGHRRWVKRAPGSC